MALYARRYGGPSFSICLMQILPHFHAKELVPPRVWTMHKNGVVRAPWFLQPRLLQLLSAFRKRWGPLKVNTWPAGGDLKERGYRLPQTSTGAQLSQHKLGAAVDFNPNGDRLTPDDIRQDIMDNEKHWYDCGLRAIEDGDIADTWVHADVRLTSLEGEIKVVRP